MVLEEVGATCRMVRGRWSLRAIEGSLGEAT
jgi:hypothetical protein